MSMTSIKREPSRFDRYSQEYTSIRMTREGGILELHFHTEGRPLEWSLLAHNELERAFLDISRDVENDVVIMTGTGDAFSGPAIEPGKHPNRAIMTKESYDPIFWEGKNLLPTLLSIAVPVIAAINGPAVRHAEIPLVSDIVIAADDTFFQDTAHFAGGMVPGDGMHVVMPHLIGPTRASYFLLTGQRLSAVEAQQLGLVNEVVPHSELLPRARELARELMKQPRLVRRYTRMILTEELRGKLHGLLGYGLALEGLARMRTD